MSKADYWYAAQVTGGREFEAEEEIVAKLSPVGTAFCPRYKALKNISRHKHRKAMGEVEKPLFSKYLFVKFGSPFQNWGLVTSLKLVEGFISAGGVPLPIRVKDVEAIRNECAAGTFNENEIEGELKIGEHIKIDPEFLMGSAFSGHDGIFMGLSNRSNAGMVELSLMGRATKIEVPTELLARILG